MATYGSIDFDDEEIEAAGHWYGGQGSMLYAITSTGALKRGSIRPRHADGTPMTDQEWIVDLAERLESEAEEAARDAAKQAKKAKGSERKELLADQDGLRSIAFKARRYIDSASSRSHATKKTATKKTAAQLDAEIADILAGPTVGPGAFKPGQRVTCSYRGEHVGKVLGLDDPRAWANTLAFPQDKPNRRAVKEHLLRHPTAGVKSIPVLYKFGVQWDRRDCLSPVSH